MPVPKKILFASACLGVVIAAYGYKSADEAGWFSSSPPALAVKSPNAPNSGNTGKPSATPARQAVNSDHILANPTTPKSDHSLLSPMVLQESVAPEALGTLARLRAQAEIKKEEVRLEEYVQRLAELQQGPPKNSGMPGVSPDVLAALMPPLVHAPSLVSLPPVSDTAPQRQAGRLLGVQSSGNKTTASVATAEGERLVAVGDTLNGSRISAISQDGIRLANGKSVGW